MISELGKVLRNFRMERGMYLKDMADGVKVTPAFLSAVETGKKQVPPRLVDELVKFLQLSAQEEENLRRSVERSVSEVKIRIPLGARPDDREALAILARTFSEMSEDELGELRSVLQSRRRG